jgi:hypothetical protein
MNHVGVTWWVEFDALPSWKPRNSPHAETKETALLRAYDLWLQGHRIKVLCNSCGESVMTAGDIEAWCRARRGFL